MTTVSIMARLGAVVCGIVSAVAMALALAFVFMWSADTSGHGELAFLVAGAGAAVVGTLCLFLRLALLRSIARTPAPEP